MKTEQLYQVYLKHRVICTDTRKITPGCLFFALKGENFDGNQYAHTALKKGAAHAIIDDAQYLQNDRFLLVDDVLSALQELAKFHRNKLTIPIIGITGSNGKTTTKELLNSVLSQHYCTYATRGNLNNHIGVPLSLLSITGNTDIAIIEMGANHQKEIGFLCSIAQPTHGLISNVGKAHLEGFGGFEGVKIAKGELYDYLKSSNGIAFINRDNQELMGMMRMKNLSHIVYYGTGNDVFINGELLNSDPFLTIKWQRELTETNDFGHLAESNLTGTYNFENILSAICIGGFFNLTPGEINAGISGYKPANNRSQLFKTANNTLIRDYYNANPSSMMVALDNLAAIPASHKVMILGDMFELGDESAKEHELIIQKANSIDAERRIFIGEEFYKLKDLKNGEFYRSTPEAFEALNINPVTQATILVKGSRGMKLEELVGLL